MYVNLKQRENKKSIKVYYIYVCESKRIDGKVKNTQRYFGSIKETELAEEDLTMLHEALTEGKFTNKEIWKVEDKLKEVISELKDIKE